MPHPKINENTLQLIDINKNKMQKLLEAQYTNRHNLDKLIITILFAEMGYLVHTVDVLVFLYIIPLIIGGIGVYVAIESYKYTTQALFYEEARKELEIYDLLEIENFDGDYVKIDTIKLNIKEKLAFYEKIVYYCLMASTLTTVEALCFYKLGFKDSSLQMFYWFLLANLIVLLKTLFWSRNK